MKILNYKRVGIRIAFAALFLAALAGCKNSISPAIQSEIDSISSGHVPDNRLGICRIIAKTGEEGTIILSGETTSSVAKQEIIKTLYNQHIKLIDSIIILPDTISNNRFMALASLSVINLRKRPNHVSEMVSQAILGTPLLILKDGESWLLVQTPDNYIAWTERSSVSMKTSKEMSAWKKADRVIFVGNSGWIYKSPSDSSIVGDLVAGCIMEKAGESKGYVKIILPDGRTGCVNKKGTLDFDVFRNQDQPDENVILRRASSLTGVPYLWGGTSAKGVDCSGFVQTVFFLNGLILQRDASLQALHGAGIDISKGFSLLQKGDLLFFGSKQNSKPHITHVAIYEGDNKYINSAGRVLVNSLDSADLNFNKYRLNSLLSARRIIGVKNDPGIVPVKKHLWY